MKAWGGRFEKATDQFIESFTSSLPFDRRLYPYDVLGSVAHVRMLAKAGILAKDEAEQIEWALLRIRDELDAGNFAFQPSDEDIHMAIERHLTGLIGPAAGKMHTARSRNDQVALDLRMYLKDQIAETAALVLSLQETILQLAEEHEDVVMPGYTHLQRAQPVLFAQHMLAYFQMLSRDFVRLLQCYATTDVMPLGSAALAGTGFPIDRKMVADELGFERISENSMDAVSDRDFVVDFLAAVSEIMLHLSRFSEEIVLWSSSEFGFVTLDDAYSTGSSIMPQKKNPDVAELVRGKSGRVFGDLFGLLATLKGLPLAYNRDLQEDKEALFDALDTVKDCLVAFEGMIGSMTIEVQAMAEAAGGFTGATDLADFLVAHDVPFREAHEIVGRMVLDAQKKGMTLEELPAAELAEYHQALGEKPVSLAPRDVVARKTSQGGTGPESVAAQLQAAGERLDDEREWVNERG